MVYRRIYFLFHDEDTARRAIRELEEKLGLTTTQVHALVNGADGFTPLPGMPAPRRLTRRRRTERTLWSTGMVPFTAALIALVLALLLGAWRWVAVFASMVVAIQLAGYLFTNRIPNAQLDRFRTALDHGEILLLVDVPYPQVRRVKQLIYHRHPEAKTNSGNWHLGTSGTSGT